MNTTTYAFNTDFEPPVVPVSQLNLRAAQVLERNFPLTWISGEVSNFTRAASGHCYFTLKDENAQVRAVMFRNRAQYSEFMPKNGDRVEVRALVTLYVPRGDFQLNVEAVRRAGMGNLYEAFLRLKSKLETEGLFRLENKQALPAFTKTIGIITSPQAAALQDVLTALQRRAPHVRLIVYPTPVQGEVAAQQIANAITAASGRAECDVLLLCRGGGSLEDLWSFNEEIVARAIAACELPIICGVGHETDITIADFTADLRAPTPTAAAEMACRAHSDWLMTLGTQQHRLRHAMQRRLNEQAQKLDGLSRRLVSPAARITNEKLKLHATAARLTHVGRTRLTHTRHALQQLQTRLAAQLPKTAAHRSTLDENRRRLTQGMRNRIHQQRQSLNALAAQLELLNPQRTLERGYAIVSNDDGQILQSPGQLHAGEAIGIQLAEGNAKVEMAKVTRKRKRPAGKT